MLRHFADIGVTNVDFLWPDYHHDDPPPWPSGTLGRYYRELFDCWYDASLPAANPLVRVGDEAPPRRGDRHRRPGGEPITDIMVESDGSWELLDTLRTCEDGMTRTGLDVRRDDVEAIWEVPLYQEGLRNQETLPASCRSCAFLRVCGGGYLAHRYRRETGFANASVWCADLLEVLWHIRARVAVDLEPACLTVS